MVNIVSVLFITQIKQGHTSASQTNKSFIEVQVYGPNQRQGLEGREAATGLSEVKRSEGSGWSDSETPQSPFSACRKSPKKNIAKCS